jgi:hypothetical protein
LKGYKKFLWEKLQGRDGSKAKKQARKEGGREGRNAPFWLLSSFLFKRKMHTCVLVK